VVRRASAPLCVASVSNAARCNPEINETFKSMLNFQIKDPIMLDKISCMRRRAHALPARGRAQGQLRQCNPMQASSQAERNLALVPSFVMLSHSVHSQFLTEAYTHRMLHVLALIAAIPGFGICTPPIPLLASISRDYAALILPHWAPPWTRKKGGKG
jgi:hypothetical protein